jgi:hypothetical protein
MAVVMKNTVMGIDAELDDLRKYSSTERTPTPEAASAGEVRNARAAVASAEQSVGDHKIWLDQELEHAEDMVREARDEAVSMDLIGDVLLDEMLTSIVDARLGRWKALKEIMRGEMPDDASAAFARAELRSAEAKLSRIERDAQRIIDMKEDPETYVASVRAYAGNQLSSVFEQFQRARASLKDARLALVGVEDRVAAAAASGPSPLDGLSGIHFEKAKALLKEREGLVAEAMERKTSISLRSVKGLQYYRLQMQPLYDLFHRLVLEGKDAELEQIHDVVIDLIAGSGKGVYAGQEHILWTWLLMEQRSGFNFALDGLVIEHHLKPLLGEQGLLLLIGGSLPRGDLAADCVEVAHFHGFGQPAVGHRAAAFQLGGDRQFPAR